MNSVKTQILALPQFAGRTLLTADLRVLTTPIQVCHISVHLFVSFNHIETFFRLVFAEYLCKVSRFISCFSVILVVDVVVLVCFDVIFIGLRLGHKRTNNQASKTTEKTKKKQGKYQQNNRTNR